MKTSQRVISGLCLVALLSIGATAQAQITVAVEDGSGNGSGAGVVAQLNDDSFADFTATLVTADDIDTPGELAAYDVVILGGSGSNNADWTVPMADAVAAWVQAGGGIILTGWGNFDMRTGVAQDETLATVIPTNNIDSVDEFVNSGETLTFVASHPVVNGIADFALPNGCCTEVNRFALESGDTVLATAGGDPAVVINTYGSGRGVYLGPVFMASESGYSTQFPALRQGELDQLMEQAVVWAARGQGRAAPNPTAQQVYIPTPVPTLSNLGLLLLGLMVFWVAARRL